MDGPVGTDLKMSASVRTAIGLLEVFTIMIIAALVITLGSVSLDVQALAMIAVLPIVIISLIFVYFCRKGRAWSFAGASILGAVGVGLRVAVSLQPNLEVGGGLPTGVTALYIVLGALVSFKNYEAYLELRAL